MKKIFCQNDRVENGKIIKCNRLIGVIDSTIIEMMKGFPGKKIIFKCSSCPSYQRWLSIGYDKEGRFTFMVENKDSINTDESNIEFDNVINIKQIG